ncbi:MAG: 30S ribosomal protein S20 [Clostridia bacterium]|nr:30S ribosomal protein S20 [Clostridia bacterium]MDD4376102.1 30S ribosomal protein S20 [Clostridia bacterium]
MPNIKSAKKRVKSNASKAVDNKIVKKQYKDAIKVFEAGVENGDKNLNELYNQASSAVDKAWSKGVLKKNTASRKISKMAKKISK